MLGAQILGLFASLIMLLIVFIKYRQRKLSRIDSVLWVVISLVIIFFSINPTTPISLLDFITIIRIDALVISGILLLFIMVLRIHLRIEDTNRALTLLVQQIALNQFEKNTKTQLTKSSTSKTKEIDRKDSF